MIAQTISKIRIIEWMTQKMQEIVTWLRWNVLRLQKLYLTQAKEASLSDITVLYKSADFVVVDKHPDVRINSNDPSHTVTVATQLACLLPEHVDSNLEHSFRFPHRLDHATSGALCVALTKAGARWQSKAFAQRYVTKHYLALVRGHMDPVKFERYHVNMAIGNDPTSSFYKMCTADGGAASAARPALTTVVLLEHGTYGGRPASKVLLIPRTGRSHQLRVHCGWLGHLVVGDYTYSERTDSSPYRMMLHAHRLVIPMKRETIDVTAPDPFTTAQDPLWISQQVFSTYQDYVDRYGLRDERTDIPEPTLWVADRGAL